jgi:hypothetical protein
MKSSFISAGGNHVRNTISIFPLPHFENPVIITTLLPLLDNVLPFLPPLLSTRLLSFVLSMRPSGLASSVSLALMPPTSSAPQPSTVAPSLNGNANGAQSDEDPFLEMDLISLNDPVDLGDFTAVWEYLRSYTPSTPVHPTPVAPVAPSVPSEISASRKQFLKKAEAVKEAFPVYIPSKTKKKSKASSTSGQPNDSRAKSEPPKSKRKSKPAMAYSSPEEDVDELSFPSSYEDNRHPFTSPRRKSYLYIPPTFSSPSMPPTPPVPAPAPAADRRRNLIQKLISKHPSEVDRILLPHSNTHPASTYLTSLATLQSQDLHIFVDNSNILIGFFDMYHNKHKPTNPFPRQPKFDFHAFSTILERGRPVARKILVGSNPLVQPVALAQQLGYDVSILERVVAPNPLPGNPYASDSATRTPLREKKKEQAVDEILHLKILECLLDVAKPATIVLATGDAAPAEFSPEGGFLKCIQRALQRGWQVELVCWRKSMSRLWRDKVFRVQWKNTFSVVELDDFLDELVLE